MIPSTLPFPTTFADWLRLPVEPQPSHPVPLTDSSLPVLIVGAGPAGLAGLAALKRANIRAEGVELHGQVGGIWDISNPVSSVYEGLHTVTSRFTSHLGQPMPDAWPNYPHHQQAHEYLVRFAQSEGLLADIRFHTRFEGAVKSPRGTWIARLCSGDAAETYEREFRALVFATGSHNRNNGVMPRSLYEEAVAGGIHAIHSAEYRQPAAFAGKRVLILGIGNSGSDIADKISHVARRTLLAVRTGPWINPQTVGGVPCDKLAADSNGLPEWLKLSWFHVIRRMSIGSFQRLGLKAPKHRLNDRLPISDRGIVQAIRRGRVTVRSHVTSFADGMAHFANPGEPPEPIDAVIFATGFGRDYPLLEAGPDPNATADALLFFMFHRREPGLCYLAEVVGLRSCWPIFVEQARTIAAYFAAEQNGRRHVDQFNARRHLPTPDCKGKLFRRADSFHVDYDRYTALVRDLAAWLSE